MRPARVFLVAPVVAVAAAAACTDLDSNCVVEWAASYIYTPNAENGYSVSHRTPQTCPVSVAGNGPNIREYLAVLYGNRSVLGPDAVAFTYHTNATGISTAPMQANAFFPQAGGDYAAQVRAQYRAGTAGCMFATAAGLIRQADYSTTSVSGVSSGSSYIGPSARVVLTYKYPVGVCEGRIQTESQANPLLMIATAIEPSDPQWMQPTTYSWTINGELSPQNGASIVYNGNPGESVWFNVEMRDAHGHEVVRSGQAQIPQTDPGCAPTADICDRP